MKISLGEGFSFGKYPLEDAAREIRAIGYEYVEILVGAHLSPQATDAEVEAVGETLRKHGLKPAAVLGGGPVGSLDEATRQQAVATVKRQIAMARRLGCDMITSEMNGGTLRQQEACIKAFKRSVAEIVPALEDAGMQAAFEPHPGDFVEDHRTALDILKDINHPRVGYLYCAPHTFILGDDAAAMIESAAGLLKWVHIADTFKQEKIVVSYAPKGYVNMLKVPEYAGEMNAHLHLVPGRGEVDFPAIFRALKRIGYQGFVSAIPFDSETSAKAASESLAKIREYLAALN